VNGLFLACKVSIWSSFIISPGIPDLIHFSFLEMEICYLVLPI